VNPAFDLPSGGIVYHQSHFGSGQDKANDYALLQHIFRKYFIVRDIGCFVLGNFRVFESCRGFWLSRSPLTADVTTEHEISLETLLASSQADSQDPSSQTHG
jgi:hypothetical protein